jgi:hypothetical protein
MGYIIAFISLVGFFGSILTIYEFVNSRIGNSPKRSQKLAFVFGTITVILIVGSLLFASILSPTGGNGSGNTPILPAKSPQTGTTGTRVPVRPSLTPLSPQTVLPSPSQQENTPPATNSPSSRTFNENKFISCIVNCNGGIILSVNYITTDTLSVYNQTWDLTITNGNLKTCSLELTRLALQDVNTNNYFEGRSPVTNSETPWDLGAVSGRGTINEDPYFSNVQPRGTFILYATISISCQDGVSFLSEQYQSDKTTI